MKFFFWQNLLSIHQSSFLRNLAYKHAVYLIVDKDLDEFRIKDGWEIPDFGNTIIVIKPTQKEIETYLTDNDSIHIFSGMDSYKLVHHAFKLAVKNNNKIGIISEPFNWLGLKSSFRFAKYFLFRIKYERKIDFLLAIGNKGRSLYEKIGYPKNKIFDWGYLTENKKNHNVKIKLSGQLPNIIYVGRLNKAKGIVPLLKIAKNYQVLFHKFIIIGQGDYVHKIKDIIKDYENFIYAGVVSNEEVRSYIAACDLTILPSIGKDGWGAVVNESLQQGVPVICSENCGASVLLDGHLRGEVFTLNPNNLEKTLKKWLKKGKNRNNEIIKEWADRKISGEVASEYFLKIAFSLYFDSEEIPNVPWLNK